MERLRGTVLSTGVATIPELGSADSFGRRPEHTVTAASLWDSSTTVSRLADLQAWADRYEETNGEPPGAIVTSRRVMRVLAAGDEFKVNLIGGGSRQASQDEVNSILEGQGLPPIEVDSRRTAGGRVIPETELLMLPAPVAPDAWEETQLGASFWGQTLSAQEAGWGIEEEDQPGIVTGVFRSPTPPMIAEVISDAIGDRKSAA